MTRKDTLVGTQEEEYFSFKQSMLTCSSLHYLNTTINHHATVLIEDLSAK